MTPIEKLIALYEENAPEYGYDGDILREEDDRTARLKYIVERELPRADRIIITAYAELDSYEKLGQLLGCSKVTARAQVERIRRQIKALW